jgi:hypothetical protein
LAYGGRLQLSQSPGGFVREFNHQMSLSFGTTEISALSMFGRSDLARIVTLRNCSLRRFGDLN